MDKPDAKDTTTNKDSKDIYILYITFGLIVILLFVWLLVIYFTRTTPPSILNSMLDTTQQIAVTP